jgi:predicted N-formylglutamate amidohydrolase
VSRKPPALLLTCEHASNRVPARWAATMAGARRALASHRGWDPGALNLARFLARRLAVPLTAGGASRLVVDLNRSRHHPRLFSQWTSLLPPASREAILDAIWRPYREDVARQVEVSRRGGRRVLHLSIHSFTPVLDGRRRDVDLGLLFDPARAGERRLARAWKPALQAALALPSRRTRAAGSPLRVRLNAPYRGTADGLTTDLRRRFPATAYIGLELEVNQRLPAGDPAAWRRLRTLILDTLGQAVGAL